MDDRIAILLCEHYLREAEAVLAAEGFAEAVVAAFPARCNHPPLLTEEVDGALHPLGDCNRFHLFGASCCLANIAEPPSGSPYILHRLPQCFSMIADQEIIDRGIQEGAYLTTPGWLADWPACLDRMGLDRKTAQEMFRDATSRIILLDTGIDPLSTFYLKDFADFVGRPYQIVPVGLSFMRLQLTQLILAWRLEKEKRASLETANGIRKQSADYATAVDLLSQLAKTTEETEAIEAMLDVFTMLFAARRVAYLPFIDGRPDQLHLRPQEASSEEREAIRARLAGFPSQSAWVESETGFLLRIVHRDEMEGVIAVEEMAFPEYREHYLNLALSIVHVCALPIDNARKYQKIRHTEGLLREANDELYRLATTDALTGIANRRSFDERLEQEWKRMQREKTPLGLIMCDIDYFKNYNDLYGHQAGDACLNAVAQAIRGSVVRPGDFAARYGGEEFVLVLPDTPVEGALHVARQIATAVRKLGLDHAGSKVDPLVTLSMGVAVAVPSQPASAAALIQAADAALYQAKKSGRNRVVVAGKEIEGA